MSEEPQKIKVERVQTGVRVEKRMLKVLKALAEYLDLSLGDLLEGMVLYAFAGKPIPITDDVFEKIETLKKVYNMNYDYRSAHQFIEEQ
ncbi:MAG: hypothetical protein ACK2T7_13250 [Anaerolineales bacterium]